MGQRVVYFSDLTNRVLEDAQGLERIVVVRHPALENGPVELEVLEDEVEFIRSGALGVVSLKLSQGNGSASDTITMEIEAFNRLAGDRDMGDVLRQAEPVHSPIRQTRPAVISTSTKLTPASTPPKLALVSAKDLCGIWPWLAALALAVLMLGLLAWTGLLSHLGWL